MKIKYKILSAQNDTQKEDIGYINLYGLFSTIYSAVENTGNNMCQIYFKELQINFYWWKLISMDWTLWYKSTTEEKSLDQISLKEKYSNQKNRNWKIGCKSNIKNKCSSILLVSCSRYHFILITKHFHRIYANKITYIFGWNY